MLLSWLGFYHCVCGGVLSFFLFLMFTLLSQMLRRRWVLVVGSKGDGCSLRIKILTMRTSKISFFFVLFCCFVFFLFIIDVGLFLFFFFFLSFCHRFGFPKTFFI